MVLEGPHAYISAGWYSIQSAPTWNYVTVQMYGIPQMVKNNDEVYRLLKDLVNFQEQNIPERERYRIESMPKDLLDNMVKAVVGFTIKVTKVECAAKLSQNRNARDYDNIITKLRAQGDFNSRAIAQLMESRRGMSEK